MEDTLAQLEDAEARFADLDKSLGELLADPSASDQQLNHLMEKFANRSKSIKDLSDIEARLKYDELMEARIKSVEEYIMDCMKLEMESKWDGRLLLDNHGLSKLPDVFSHIAPFILELTIRNNRFTSIPQAVLSLPNIRVLDMSGNPLSEIPHDLILPKSVIDVRLDHVFSIPAGGQSPRTGKDDVPPKPFCFSPFSHVQSLSIRANGLTSLSEDISCMNSLQILDVSENPLVRLPANMHHLTSVKILKLSGCGVDSHGIESLSSLTQLEQLYIDQNKISHIPYGIWKSFHDRQKETDLHLEGNPKSVEEILEETKQSKPSEPNLPVAQPLIQEADIPVQEASAPNQDFPESDRPSVESATAGGLSKCDSVTSFFSKGTTGDVASVDKFERRLDPEEVSELFYITVEHCLNCEEHQMTTRHVPESYNKAFRGIVSEIAISFPNLEVRRADPNPRKRLPRLGSFEVTLVSKNGPMKYALYSKLERKKFPNPTNITKRLESYFQLDEK